MRLVKPLVAFLMSSSVMFFARSELWLANDRSSMTASTHVTEHRYRITGKVRLLFFWVSDDDVGGARLTDRTDESTRTISLLIGSDPHRAPRGLNEWGYIAEKAQGDTVYVFGVRSVANPKSVEEAESRLAQGKDLAPFGAMCSQVTTTEDRAAVTSIRVPNDVTYRDVARVLDVVGASGHWLQKRVPRPMGAEPGFLAALERLIHASVSSAQQGSGSGEVVEPTVYLYKGEIFDLRLTRARRLATIRIGSEILRDLIRGEFLIHNRSTGDRTRFTVTYGVTGALAGVPVQASYQPRRWLKLELALDPNVTVPPDPAGDQSLVQRIGDICRAATTPLPAPATPESH